MPIITERTLRGLLAMHRYRFLGIAQFAKASGLKPASAGDALRDLERKKILGWFGNVGIRGYGKTPKLYYLTRRGFEVLIEVSGMADELGQYKIPHTGTRWSPVMYHRLATVDLMLAMEHAVRSRAHFKVAETFIEYRRVKRGQKVVSETSDYVVDEERPDNRITPDASFILEQTQKGKRALFFLETDMGSETIEAGGDDAYSIIKKLRQYERYLVGGRFAQTYAPFGDFRFAVVLFVTCSPVRIGNVRERSGTLDKRMHSFFRLGAFDEVSEDFLGGVWRSRDVTDDRLHALVRKDE